MPNKIIVDDVTVSRLDGLTASGGAYAIIVTDARGRSTTTEFSKTGAELCRYDGQPKPLPLPVPEPTV